MANNKKETATTVDSGLERMNKCGDSSLLPLVLEIITNYMYSRGLRVQQVPKVMWQKASAPNCHPSRLRMDSSDLDPV